MEDSVHTTLKDRNREIISMYKADGCSICGYNKCNAALDFHHIDTATKGEVSLSSLLSCLSERLVDEIEKCMVVCANCHREIHDKERSSNKGEKLKKRITIRVDEDVLEWFRSGGEGYQGRMNDALRIYMNGMNTPYLDSTEFYKDGPREMVAFEIPNTIKSADTVYEKDYKGFFRPMPKPEKGKKPRCRP